MKISLILSKANNTESPCFAVRSDASESGRSEPRKTPHEEQDGGRWVQ